MALVLAAAAAIVFLVGCTEGPQMAREAVEPDHPFPALDAYGAWIDYPALGRVWQPYVAYDWRPFADGQWIWTDRGWFWDSPEPFGWIVYHYGFWTHQAAAGWLWVPGYEWSPARVRWYEDETMIGWAPLLPAGFGPQESEFGWITIQPQYFVRENVGHYATRGTQLPSARRIGDERRQPDVRTIERAAARRIEKLATDSETVRSGQKQVQRVKVGRRAPEGGAPPPSVGGAGSRPGDRPPELKKDPEKAQSKSSAFSPTRAGNRATGLTSRGKTQRRPNPSRPTFSPTRARSRPTALPNRRKTPKSLRKSRHRRKSRTVENIILVGAGSRSPFILSRRDAP